MEKPVHQGLFSYWDRKRAGRIMPSRADLDPVDIPNLLAFVGLIDVLESPRRYRYRLVGTGLVNAFGRETTGRELFEAGPARYAGFLSRLYTMCCAERAPILVLGTCRYRDTLATRTMTHLLLPLSTDGVRVDMILYSSLNEPDRQCLWLNRTADHIDVIDGDILRLEDLAPADGTTAMPAESARAG